MLERELGRGATAQVYAARHKEITAVQPTPSLVALKVFHPAFWDNESSRKRAHSEFRMVSALQHPNVVRVLEAFWDHDPPAVALELIDGFSLEAFQPRLPYVLPELSALIMIEVLAALEYAHAQGVVHRDLKPANILISHEGRVVVSDFGLAKMIDVSRVTASGTLLGSPDYMAPEQACGDATTPQSDLFSAAALLYFLVTGTRPFTRHTPLATLTAVMKCEPEPVGRRNPKLSAAFAAIIHRGLARDPALRYATASSFRADLLAYLDAVGLPPTVFSMPLWMESPSETCLNALRSMGDRLTQTAEAAIASRAWPQALEGLNHLNLVAPESQALGRLAEVYRHQRRSENRSKRHRAAWPLAALMLALLVGVSAILGVRRHRLARRQETPRTWQVATPTGPLIVEGPLKEIPSSALEKQPPPVRRRPQGKVSFDIPEGIAVFWDGHLAELRKPFQARTGWHEVRFEKAGFAPIQQRIEVKADDPTVIRVVN